MYIYHINCIHYLDAHLLDSYYFSSKPGLWLRVCTKKLISYFSTKTYVVGTQKNRLIKHMLKLMS